jgi:glycosyltransferase involved in cell wall biosynthesis
MIVIVAERGIGFPNGTAPTSRVTGYARGLKAGGAEVLVLCLGTSEPSPPEAAVNTEVGGVVHGIPFEYTCGSTIRSTKFWSRRWSRVHGLVGAARRIRRQRSAGPVEAVLLYSKSSLDAAVLHFVSRWVGAVYIVELCELPFPTLRGVVLGRVRRDIYNRTFFRWFDAAIVISDRLRQHIAAFGTPETAVLKVPVMVDTDEFRPMPEAVESPPVITYCGLLNEEKDGVAALMRAFARVVADLPQLHLRLIGDTYHGTRIPEFRTVAERLGIADKVSFVGSVARSEVPAFLARASVLVLARPRSPQAEAGMPTKVAEYLASGVPTVLTRTGEIGTFLESGVSAYLVPPDDVPALATALRHVLLHSAEAANVGRRGREVAVQSFDYRVVGARVAAFIADLEAR